MDRLFFNRNLFQSTVADDGESCRFRHKLWRAMSSFLGIERLFCGHLKHSFAIFAVSGWSKPFFWRGLDMGSPAKGSKNA
jgi:hypothetical protein